AIIDHAERLINLMQLTRDFQKVLITCRTQFFPKDEEIPIETGIVKIGPVPAGHKAQYIFHKLYISPFTMNQIEDYLKRRFPIWKKKCRKQARDMIEKIPKLSVRPMLLAHIEDLVGKELELKYAFQVYEEMVEAWLIREEGKLEGIKKEPLRDFSELLAIEIFKNREQRKSERIPKSALTEFAESFKIPLEDWQLSGRSLLNRDAVGNYKFAHRSIMEYLFVKRFLEIQSDARPKIEWTDQMFQFLYEMINHYQEHNMKLADLTHIDLKRLIKTTKGPLYKLRSKKKSLFEHDVHKMIRQYNMFEFRENLSGRGLFHLYDVDEENGIVIDHTTGLMWQQSGTPNRKTYKDAEKWIANLNWNCFAGYSDWRLPTLEEAMSLMESEKKNRDLYIHPVFDNLQRWIWTADKVKGDHSVYAVFFHDGLYVIRNIIYNYGFYVRAVRSF
ncbi:MAG: DUF1566 domain-containing protein, partial [Candidatus Lokiarchaeota archaeon]|nr:DUF1566 domain-containing protein [Candidatus Lokiarchaeota archaeon]